MKLGAILFFLASISNAQIDHPWNRGRLLPDVRDPQIRNANNLLKFESGQQANLFCDTAYAAIENLNETEMDQYLDAMRAINVNCVMVSLLFGYGSDSAGRPSGGAMTHGNVYNKKPFLDPQPTSTRPPIFDYRHGSQGYWALSRIFVEKARARGIYVMLITAWGDKASDGSGRDQVWFLSPPSGSNNTTIAYNYAKEVGDYFAGLPNVIPVLLGDRNPIQSGRRPRPDLVPVLDALARGWQNSLGQHQYVVHHGGALTAQFPTFVSSPGIQDHLLFHTVQSGHGDRANGQIYDAALWTHRSTETLGAFNHESNYVTHPIFWRCSNGLFNNHDGRRAAYAGAISGMVGHMIGSNNRWPFPKPARPGVQAGPYHPEFTCSGSRWPWTDTISTGPRGSYTRQMGYANRLLQSRPLDRRPAPGQFNVQNVGPGFNRMAYSVGDDHRSMLIYNPTNSLSASVDLSAFNASQVDVFYLNPRDGRVMNGGTIATQQGQTPLRAPSAFAGSGAEDDVIIAIEKSGEYPNALGVVHNDFEYASSATSTFTDGTLGRLELQSGQHQIDLAGNLYAADARFLVNGPFQYEDQSALIHFSLNPGSAIALSLFNSTPTSTDGTVVGIQRLGNQYHFILWNTQGLRSQVIGGIQGNQAITAQIRVSGGFLDLDVNSMPVLQRFVVNTSRGFSNILVNGIAQIQHHVQRHDQGPDVYFDLQGTLWVSVLDPYNSGGLLAQFRSNPGDFELKINGQTVSMANWLTMIRALGSDLVVRSFSDDLILYGIRNYTTRVGQRWDTVVAQYRRRTAGQLRMEFEGAKLR